MKNKKQVTIKTLEKEATIHSFAGLLLMAALMLAAAAKSASGFSAIKADVQTRERIVLEPIEVSAKAPAAAQKGEI